MTLKEIKEYLYETVNAKVTHHYFSLENKNGKVQTKEGYYISKFDEFWEYRTDPYWQEDWEIITEESKTN